MLSPIVLRFFLPGSTRAIRYNRSVRWRPAGVWRNAVQMIDASLMRVDRRAASSRAQTRASAFNFAMQWG